MDRCTTFFYDDMSMTSIFTLIKHLENFNDWWNLIRGERYGHGKEDMNITIKNIQNVTDL